MSTDNSKITLGSRVSEPGSWNCATVIRDYGDSCVIEYDYYIRQNGKRTEYKSKEHLELTNYYNECNGSWSARRKGIPTVAPEWKGKR